MYRIPLACEAPNQEMPHAPIVTGILSNGAYASPALGFVVDTGADRTTVTKTGARLPTNLYKTAQKERSTGVGGYWASRRFGPGFTLTVRAIQPGGTETTVNLGLPTLSVMAPFADFSKNPEQPQEMILIAADDRRLKPRAGRPAAVRQCPEFRPLFGRDVLVACAGRLVYAPTGESFLEVPPPGVSVGAAALATPRPLMDHA